MTFPLAQNLAFVAWRTKTLLLEQLPSIIEAYNVSLQERGWDLTLDDLVDVTLGTGSGALTKTAQKGIRIQIAPVDGRFIPDGHVGYGFTDGTLLVHYLVGHTRKGARPCEVKIEGMTASPGEVVVLKALHVGDAIKQCLAKLGALCDVAVDTKDISLQIVELNYPDSNLEARSAHGVIQLSFTQEGRYG